MTSKNKPPRGRPTEAELERRKSRVLEVARKLFMEHGYAGTSVAEIAKRARVSPRMIASHFGEKEDIFTQVIIERNKRASSIAVETSSAGSLEDILFSAAKACWTTLYSPEAISYGRLIAGEGARFEAQTREMARASAASFFGILESIFSGLYRRGLITQKDHVKSAKYFFDLMVGASQPQAMMGYMDMIPTDDELKEKIVIFRNGWLEAPKEPAQSNAGATASATKG